MAHSNTAFENILGRIGVVENMCTHLKLHELSALESIHAGLVIPPYVWALSASYRLTRFALAPGAVEAFTKQDAKSMVKSLKALWIAQTKPDFLEFPKRVISPKVFLPTSGCSRSLLTAVTRAEMKAEKHLAKGGKVAKVFVARFLFETEHLQQMTEMLSAQKRASPPDGSVLNVPCCTSHTAMFPMERIPDRKTRRKHERNKHALIWQVPTVNLAMSWAAGRMWLENVKPPMGEFRGSEVTTPLMADVVGVSENVTLRMNGVELIKNQKAKGVSICSVSSLQAMYKEITSEGLTCVLLIHDYDEDIAMDSSMLSRNVQALQISYNAAYIN